MRRRRQLGRLGKWVEVQPYGKCDFTGYHGTYKLRAGLIKSEGLRVPAKGGGIWFTKSPRYAFEHIAKRAVLEGCPDEPLVVLKVRVVGSKDHCPVYRPIHARTIPGFYMTNESIPPARILGEAARNAQAINRGKEAGFKRLKKVKKPRPVACPPPIELRGRRRR